MSDHPFGLSEYPFADGNDPRFIFPAERRVEAVAQLRKRIAEGESFVVVTGEPGCGKTSVVTEMLTAADLAAKVACITHPSLTPAELLEAVCIEFGAPLPNPPSKPQTLVSLEHHLGQLRAQGVATLLVLDEAHGLKTELLEEVRLLSNMRVNGRGLLQTLLVGLPELERRLGLPELAQLRQRIGFHCRLAPLTEPETEQYVQHRVGAAGGDGAGLFPPETCQEIHSYTNGMPRDINTLAGHALEHAGQEGADTVSVEDVRVAAGDARPRGIATAARNPTGGQPFELRRKSPAGRAAYKPARAAERPAASGRVVEPAEGVVTSEARQPLSFLRAQLTARAGAPKAAAPTVPEAEPTTLEQRFRSGDITLEELTAGRLNAAPPAPRDAWSSSSDGMQELGASVILVGLLIVVLLASGRWDPVMSRRAAPPVDHPTGAAPGTDPATTPEGPGTLPAAVGGDRGPSDRVLPEGSDPGSAPAGASRAGFGYEVASLTHADSAAAVLRRIQRGSRLPAQILTKTTGHPYRVVVGPFASRRDAEKALRELLRSSLVERARLVQVPE